MTTSFRAKNGFLAGERRVFGQRLCSLHREGTGFNLRGSWRPLQSLWEQRWPWQAGTGGRNREKTEIALVLGACSQEAGLE